MIWDRIPFIRALIPHKGAAGESARRWRNARAVDAELARDVIRFCGLMQMQPAVAQDGLVLPVIDRDRMIYDAGRRDLGLQLLALMGVSQTELNSMMEDR